MGVSVTGRPCANTSKQGGQDKHSLLVLQSTGTTDLSKIVSVGTPIKDKNNKYSWTAHLLKTDAAFVVIRLTMAHGRGPAPKKRKTRTRGIDTADISVTLTDSAGASTTYPGVIIDVFADAGP